MDITIEVGDAQEFSRLLKHYRETGRLSQSRLAEVAGFDHSYVSRLESGNRTPTRDAVTKLGDALELAPEQRDKLLAAAGYMPDRLESLLAGEPVLTEVLRLLQNRDVPEPVRANLRQMLELVVSQARLAATGHPRGAGPDPDALAA